MEGVIPDNPEEAVICLFPPCLAEFLP